MTEIKKSINATQVVGTLAEMNLVMEEKEVILDPNGKAVKVTCKTIGKADFKQPSLLVECSPVDEDGNVRYTANIGVHFFQTHEKKLDEKGKVIDNPRFKSMETILEKYIPKNKVKGDEEPTRVQVDGSLVANEYATEQGEYKSFLQINAFQCTSTNVSDKDICEGEISGIIRTISKEVVGEEEKETGRLKVELYTFDNQGKTTPINLVVEEDLADDVADFYTNGQSVKLYYEILVKRIGGRKQSAEGGFGRRKAEMTSGFEITEYSIFKGDDAFEEENDYFIPLDVMKEAMKAREIMIEQKIKEKKEKTKSGGASSKSSKPQGLGNRPSQMKPTEPQDDEDNPF